jgi:hypothetical protein
LQVGIIHVPVQERPIYLKRDLGRLKRNVVFIRRGSSTAEADPDEIARMGKAEPLAPEAPQLILEFAALSERSLLGKATTLDTIAYSVPRNDEIPDFDPATGHLSISTGRNRDFFRDLACYLRDFFRVKPLRLAVTNVGNTIAHDVRVEAHMSGFGLIVVDEYDLPSVPVRETPVFDPRSSIRPSLNTDLYFERVRDDDWRIIGEFGKCQPKQTVYTGNMLYVGAYTSAEFTLDSRMFADELPHPIETNMCVNISVDRRDVSLEQLLAFCPAAI